MLSAQDNQVGDMRTLPLATLYLTERCNSRCVSCDYWRHGRVDASLERITGYLAGLKALRTEVVLLSGGEPLLNREWRAIAALLRDQGLRVWLLTSGLALKKHAQAAHALFESITVSLDGSCAQTYQAIRGVDAFEQVCAGIRAATALGAQVSLRITVQRANYTELARFVSLGRKLGVRKVSFLAADVANPHAFGRSLPDGFAGDIALAPQDLPRLEAILDAMESSCACEFASGFIAESPQKLRRILAYYTAVCGLGTYPQVHCNAPQFSAVIEADGRLRPCFFIPGDGTLAGNDVAAALNDPAMRRLRTAVRLGMRSECARCVCSMWREPQAPWAQLA